MLKLRAEDYGFEPGVTGFEESNNLAYLDGKREGKRDAKLEDAKNLIGLGCDDQFIVRATGLDLMDIHKIRRELK